MLEDLPFNGTLQVVNKGTDICLVIRQKHRAEAMCAAKICGVCGISTAVLLLPEKKSPDKRTLDYFMNTVQGFVFAEAELIEKIKPFLSANISHVMAREETQKGFTEAVFALKKAADKSI